MVRRKACGRPTASPTKPKPSCICVVGKLEPKMHTYRRSDPTTKARALSLSLVHLRTWPHTTPANMVEAEMLLLSSLCAYTSDMETIARLVWFVLRGCGVC